MIKRFKNMSINNIKVKNKLIIIYISCVLIPIVLINMLFYLKIKKAVIEKQNYQYSKIMDGIEDNIINDIEQCISVSNIIYSDSSLYKWIDNKYSSRIDYYEVYNNYIQTSLLKYIPSYYQIDSVNIYTSNDSIINSAGFVYLDETSKKADWYKIAVKSNKNFIIIPNSGIDSTYKKKIDSISIIRKLDNYNNYSDFEKYLKIDINLNVIIDNMIDSNIQKKFEIFNDGGTLIYSNPYQEGDKIVDSNLADNAITIDSIINNPDCLKNWKLRGVFDNSSVLSPMKESQIYIIYLTMISLLFATIIIIIISRSFSIRLSNISQHMNKVKEGQFEIIEDKKGSDEIGQLAQDFNIMTVEIKNLISDVYESKILKQKLELENKQSIISSLQSEINPHFLFNTFESIRVRCLLKEENETAHIIENLALTFRRMISWNKNMIDVKEEIEYIKAFLEIQQYRFNNIKYSIDIDENCLNYKIPKMILQPLVENSIEHGVGKKKGEGIINISINKNDDRIIFIICDNGIGINQESLKHILVNLKSVDNSSDNIGIKNVYLRLKLMFGEEIDFKIESIVNLGTKISFSLPII